jgi:hypothetical protein
MKIKNKLISILSILLKKEKILNNTRRILKKFNNYMELSFKSNNNKILKIMI